jgi:hypothetical protein
MSEIVVLKLVSGEEIVAGLKDNLSGNKMYAKPRVFLTQQTSQGIGAALVPYIWSAPDETISIRDDLIVTCVKPSKQLEDSYLQHTSSIDLSATKI